MFADRAKIYIRSGKGGNGHISFRREKYVPNGGPDGGDGGDGGGVLFIVDEGMNTLSTFRHIRTYCAEDGAVGGKRNCRGKNGADITIKVPPGTIIKEAQSEKIIADMSGDQKELRLLKGGKGGNGNQHYATSTMQAPKYAQPGQPAQELTLLLELKLIADVGLIGFPNVGKSTLLSQATNANPKIANYHFTTLSPNLGVVDLEDAGSFVIADIPGLIEGASAGAGLGHEFLRHIERTRLMIHMVDAASTEGRDPVQDVYAINKELEAYHPELLRRPQVICANKMDVLQSEGENPVDRLSAAFTEKGYKVFPVSAVTGEGLMNMLYYVQGLLKEQRTEPVVFEQEYFPEFHLEEEAVTVKRGDRTGLYLIEGPKIEKMLGYTNLDTEKGFAFFQKFMKETGILTQLEKLGIEDGDTVRIDELEFDYYK